MEHAFTVEDLKALKDFQNASLDDQKCMLFDALMGLLTEAVGAGDAESIANYARLVTEMWNDRDSNWGEEYE